MVYTFTELCAVIITKPVKCDINHDGAVKVDLRQDCRSSGSLEMIVLIWDWRTWIVWGGTEGYCLVALDWREMRGEGDGKGRNEGMKGEGGWEWAGEGMKEKEERESRRGGGGEWGDAGEGGEGNSLSLRVLAFHSVPWTAASVALTTQSLTCRRKSTTSTSCLSLIQNPMSWHRQRKHQNQSQLALLIESAYNYIPKHVGLMCMCV